MIASKNYIFLAAGMSIGLAAVFADVEPPLNDGCVTYKVAHKVATSYVLKPPTPNVIYQACPQTTEIAAPEVIPQQPRRRHHRRHR